MLLTTRKFLFGEHHRPAEALQTSISTAPLNISVSSTNIIPNEPTKPKDETGEKSEQTPAEHADTSENAVRNRHDDHRDKPIASDCKNHIVPEEKTNHIETKHDKEK